MLRIRNIGFILTVAAVIGVAVFSNSATQSKEAISEDRGGTPLIVLGDNCKDSEECVQWVRNNRVRSLPNGLTTLADKKRIINSNTPTAGSVAVIDANSKYGHVAYVKSVNRDGSLTLEESNWDHPCKYGTRTGKPGAKVSIFWVTTSHKT